MKVVVFGGSGMVGQGVLRECLLDAGVNEVLSVGRTPSGRTDPKLREILVADLFELDPQAITDADACFFCLGVSSAGMTEPDYRRLTYDLTLSVANKLVATNPAMTFIYVSGAGTDSTEQGRTMWARVKGATENALLRLPFRGAYMFRPGMIQPRHGIKSKTRLYRVLYVITAPLIPLLRRLFPNQVTTTEQVGRAMLKVVRDGWKRPFIETQDIELLGAP